MTSATEAHAVSTALPGLDHLRGNVQNWEEAVQTLSLTATAIAESVGAGTSLQSLGSCNRQFGTSFQTGVPSSLGPAPAFVRSEPPTLVVSGTHLKPGRVFVVANLQGAYYTLLEILSRHKFDFRSDNLLHLGNLVAAPAPAAAAAPPPPPPPPLLAGTAAAATAVTTPGGAQSKPSCPSRRVRNSTSVLKLVRRHGSVGPMGAHECLGLLAAAHTNRLFAQQRAEEDQRLASLLGGERQDVTAEAIGPVKPGLHNVRPNSALSMQLAAAAAGMAPARCMSAPKPLTWLESDSDSSDSDSLDSDEMEVEMVAAPMTPHWDERDLSAAAAAADVAVRAGGLCLENADLTHMLSMPACVILESYRVRLLHASSTDAVDARYHTLFSHRGPGVYVGDGGSTGAAVATAAGGGNASATGLASCRDIVRFAVLPPLRILQRRSPGFAAKMVAGAGPSREELMLEILEEPLSELDA